MAAFLLDTNVIIDVLNNKRGRAALLTELLEAGHVLACCPINVAEVHVGLRPKEEAATEAFLASLKYIPITYSAARLAGGYKRHYARKGVTLNLADVIIAAVAVESGLTLLTGNHKDFPMENLSLYRMPRG